VVAKRTERL